MRSTDSGGNRVDEKIGDELLQYSLQAIVLECQIITGTTDVSSSSNFFEIGGTSLDALELREALEINHQLIIGLEDLFNSGSLDEMSSFCKWKNDP
ncbi:MAG: acyl carrier protein [Acidimicrobiales bacterium]